MFDFKLLNTCNHRIINEKLVIKGDYPNYYATLKRPVFGNNLKIRIVDEDNIFSENPKEIKYILGNDFKTIKLNIDTNEVDVRKEIYPRHTYYATYSTDNYNCPKCIEGTNKTCDIYINSVGRPKITQGLDLLVQKIKKIIITRIQSNFFDETYGSEIPNLIGKPKTVLALLRAQSTIQDAIEHIKKEQLQNYSILSNDEKLWKIDNFQVEQTTNPKILKFSFEIYNISGDNVNIGVSI